MFGIQCVCVECVMCVLAIVACLRPWEAGQAQTCPAVGQNLAETKPEDTQSKQTLRRTMHPRLSVTTSVLYHCRPQRNGWGRGVIQLLLTCSKQSTVSDNQLTSPEAADLRWNGATSRGRDSVDSAWVLLNVLTEGHAWPMGPVGVTVEISTADVSSPDCLGFLWH